MSLICCSETKNKNKQKLHKKPKIYFDNIEPFKDNNNVKLEPRLLNIKENHFCRIKLNIFTDGNYIKKGETEKGFVDPETEIMSFQKFFMMKYQFEKNQPIEFEITGTIEAKIQTNLQNIIGGREQTFKKTIKEADDVILEIKGFSYKNEKISILNIDISMNGNIENTGLIYKIIDKKDKEHEMILYRSEGIKPIKTEKEINYIRCEIPDINICKKQDNEKDNEEDDEKDYEKDYEKYRICISFEDVLNGKYLGEYK